MSMEFAIYAALFVGVFITVVAGYLLVANLLEAADPLERRFRRVARAGAPMESEIIALRRARRRQRRSGLLSGLAAKAREAGLAIGMGGLLALIALAGLVLFVVLSRATPLALGPKILVAAVMAYAGAWLWLTSRIERQRALFHEQMPDALDLMARTLKIGQPINAAVAAVARDMPAPIGPDFAEVANEVTYGMSLAEAIDRLAERKKSQDLRFLTVAVSIQAQSGGNLVEVLEGLASVIRARFNMFRKVRAVSSEARVSGYFLSAFPVLLIFALQATQPTYFDAVRELPSFNFWAGLTMGLLVLNVLFMRVLLRVKV